MEEVKVFKYFEYVMQRNGVQKVQVRDRVRKAAVTMRQGDRKEKIRRRLGEGSLAV